MMWASKREHRNQSVDLLRYLAERNMSYVENAKTGLFPLLYYDTPTVCYSTCNITLGYLSLYETVEEKEGGYKKRRT